jgi:hypothetical protein
MSHFFARTIPLPNCYQPLNFQRQSCRDGRGHRTRRLLWYPLYRAQGRRGQLEEHTSRGRPDTVSTYHKKRLYFSEIDIESFFLEIGGSVIPLHKRSTKRSKTTKAISDEGTYAPEPSRPCSPLIVSLYTRFSNSLTKHLC